MARADTTYTTYTTAFAVTHRKAIIVLTLAFMALAAVIGGDVQSQLKSAGFDDPNAESSHADVILTEEFNAGAPEVILLVTAADGDVDAADVAQAATAVQTQIAGREDVLEVASYWSLGSPPPLRSEGGDRAIMMVRLVGDDDAKLTTASELREEFEGDAGPIEIGFGGFATTFSQVNEIIEELSLIHI